MVDDCLPLGLFARACDEQDRSIMPQCFRGVSWLSNAELVQARRFFVDSFACVPGLSRLLLFEYFLK